MTSQLSQFQQRRARIAALACLPFVIAAGLYFKYYRGPGHQFVNNFGPASVAYVLLFMLLAFALLPRRSKITGITVGVLLGTCVVEFSQRWKPDWLEAVRATLPGSLVLGSTFSWWDFPAYLTGTVVGFLLLRAICNRAARASLTQVELSGE